MSPVVGTGVGVSSGLRSNCLLVARSRFLKDLWVRSLFLYWPDESLNRHIYMYIYFFFLIER